MGKNSITPIINGFKECLYIAPLPVLCLVIYMGLRSSIIFPDGLPSPYEQQQLWQRSYLGWYDFLFLSSVVISFILSSLKLAKDNFIFIWTIALIILLSLINGLTLGKEVALDALVNFFRFACAFSLSVWLVRRLGSKAAEALIVCLFIILAITALLVYSLQFRTFVRIYASAMAVASFSQVTVIVCFIALLRKYNCVLGIALIFLVMTFSKTSILLFLFLLLFSGKFTISNQLKYLFFILFVAVSVVFIALKIASNEYTAFFSFYTDIDNIFTLSGRTPIWEYALHLLQSGNIPLLGVGFNAAASLFAIGNFYYFEVGKIYYYPHFHSILIEYGFGFGILSGFIFFIILKRIWQTFRSNCNLSFLIFSFFFLCQSLDFTFYLPKEMIIWSLILGLAEGQWRYERGY